MEEAKKNSKEELGTLVKEQVTKDMSLYINQQNKKYSSNTSDDELHAIKDLSTFNYKNMADINDEVSVWRSGLDDAPKKSLDSNFNSKNKLFALDNDSCTSATDVTESSSTDIESLDEAINGGIMPELQSISDLSCGQQKLAGNPKKCRKAKDLKPMVFITFNISHG